MSRDNFDTEFGDFLMDSWFSQGLLTIEQDIQTVAKTAKKAFRALGSTAAAFAVGTAAVLAAPMDSWASGVTLHAPPTASARSHELVAAPKVSDFDSASSHSEVDVDSEIDRIKGNIFSLIGQLQSGEAHPLSAEITKLARDAGTASRTRYSGTFLKE